jgi:glycosyltransferase involved in cell wall biosynthesis
MDTGGAERVTLNLLNGFIEDSSLELDLVLVHKRGGYLEQVPPEVNVIDLGASRIITSAIPLARYLRSRKPDILLSALVTANIVAVAAAVSVRFHGRVVVAEHNDFATALANNPSRRAQIAPWLMRRTYPRADEIIAVSQGVATGLSQAVGLDGSSISVVPNPVITADVRSKVVDTPDHPWFKENSPVALAVGRLQPQKNFQLLIEAFALIAQDHDLRLIIYGEGDERPRLQALIDSLGLTDRIDLAGLTTNPYAAMRAARMLVMSSKFEGLPTVLIEALFCGTAVISTNCPSGPDEILANGRYGTLVPMDDAELLGEALTNELNVPSGPAPPEAWAPYTEDVVLEQYRSIMTLSGP